MNRIFLGELIGTFILVFLGCGIVGLSILEGAVNLLHIALIWGVAVFLGIIASVKRSYAHLNPAVSLGFLVMGMIKGKEFIYSVLGQITGALIAGGVLASVFSPYLSVVEQKNNWVREDLSGLNTAKMFGEYYDIEKTSVMEGFSIELFGTFLLVYMIFIYVKNVERFPVLTYAFIGLTVSILIMFIAPITQCGINPARDFGPRLISYIAGWEQAFYLPNYGAVIVYVAGPLTGGVLAAVFYKLTQLFNKD